MLTKHPNDGREYDCQCARCGSSCDWVECDQCEDGYSYHDCGEDCCCCLDPEPNVKCDICEGEGGWHCCMSSREWCQANPLEGRENVERGTVEWFLSQLTREEVAEWLRLGCPYRDAEYKRQLCRDWLEMHDALRLGISLASLHAMTTARDVDIDREHHKRHDENREALERRINEHLRDVAGLRVRLAAIEQRTRGDEE